MRGTALDLYDILLAADESGGSKRESRNRKQLVYRAIWTVCKVL